MRGQVAGQRGVKRLVGAEQLVIHLLAEAPASQPVEKSLQFLEVGGAEAAGVGHHVGQPFQPSEASWLPEGEFQFVGVQDMEHDHVVAAMAQVFQPGYRRGGVVQQVAQDEYHAALGEPLGQLVEDRADVGFRGGRGGFRR